MKLKPTDERCPKCNSKTEEIYWHLGVIRNQCTTCNLVFKPEELKKSL